MNNYSFADYVNTWFVTPNSGRVLSFEQYKAVKAEVMEVLEESFK
jgi:hypothetical protein